MDDGPHHSPLDPSEYLRMTGRPCTSRRMSSRGAVLVIGLFALGGAVLWGLFHAPRATSPAAPVTSEWGVPTRRIRVASFNVLHLQRGIDAVVREVRVVDPDVVFLQEVEAREVIDLVR